MRRCVLIVSFILYTGGTAFAQTWEECYDSTALYWEKDWNKTISLLSKALPLAEKEIGIEHPNYAVLLNDLGLSYWNTGNFSMAETALERSLRLKKITLGEEDPDYTATVLNLAGLFHDMNKHSKAEGLYLQVLEGYKGVDHKDAYYVTALNSLGNLYEEEANYALAETQYLQALSYKAETAGEEHPTYAKVLNSLGSLYQKTERTKEAEDCYLKAMAIYEDGSYTTLDYAAVLSNYGLFNAENGFFGTAEQLLNKSKNIIEQIRGSKNQEYASALNNLGTLYWRMGNRKAAESHYVQAMTLFEEIVPENSVALAPSLNNLAGYYVGEHNFEKAFPLYLKTREIYASHYGIKHPLYASALNNIASLYRKTGNYEKAELLYRQALDIEKEVLGESHPQYAASLQNTGLLSIAMGKYEEAATLMYQAIDIKKSILGPQHPSWAKTYNNLALLHFIQGRLKEAAPYFEKALVNQFHQIKNVFPALSEKEKEAFYNTLKNDIERFNTFALAQYEENPAISGTIYNNQLVTKGLLFDASTKVRERIFQLNDTSLIRKYNQWRESRDKLAAIYSLPKEHIIERKIDVHKLEEHVNELEKELSSQSFALNPQQNWQVLSWEDIRDTLSPGEAAIEMIRFREFKIKPQLESPGDTTRDMHIGILYGWTEKVNYAALIITPETTAYPKLVLLEDGEKLENKYFSYYANAIRYRVEDTLSFQYYWKDIQKELPAIKTVYFSPDGAYYKINLNTLFDPALGKYLFDTLTIKQLTSTRDLIRENVVSVADKNAVLLGAPDFNYSLETAAGSAVDTGPLSPESGTDSSGITISMLPGTKKEVEKIAILLRNNQWDTHKFIEESAKEEVLKQLNSPSLLHIATHGYFNDFEGGNELDKSPLLNSGILLAGAQRKLRHNRPMATLRGEDGILTAYEAMNLKLDNTDLVVLSACETGAGTIKNGEGVYGLQRAFQVAGAESIIFSLWKVNDEATQKLMGYFYERWMHTGNKRSAFSWAQQKLREEFAHPYYWGGFVLIGE